MNALAAYGLLAHGLIFGAVATLLPLGVLRARVGLAATALSLMVGIAPAMHGFFGTPSVSLLALAVLQLAERTPSPLSGRAALWLLTLAVPFHVVGLGGAFDLYAVGYQPSLLLAGLLPLGIVLWWKRLDAWLIILAADLAAYASGAFANLWDVLVDPLLLWLALIVVLRQRVILFIASRRR